jgi:hypothetical protein
MSDPLIFGLLVIVVVAGILYTFTYNGSEE